MPHNDEKPSVWVDRDADRLFDGKIQKLADICRQYDGSTDTDEIRAVLTSLDVLLLEMKKRPEKFVPELVARLSENMGLFYENFGKHLGYHFPVASPEIKEEMASHLLSTATTLLGDMDRAREGNNHESE